MPDIQHKYAQQIHTPFAWRFSNAANRAAFNAAWPTAGVYVPTANDLYRKCLQTDDNSEWMLSNHAPVTWVKTKQATTSADISDSTAVGRNLLTSADQAAARGALGLGTAATSNVGDFDPAGAATAAVVAHVALPDPHTQYALEAGLGSAAYADVADFDPAGQAADEMANHLAAANPHPQYIRTAQIGVTVESYMLSKGLCAMVLTCNGNGSALTSGDIKEILQVPFNMTITGWQLLADVSGSVVIDVKKCDYAGFPTFASIAGTEKPTLASVQKNQDLTLTTWTTGLLTGDAIQFNLSGISTVTAISLIIFAAKA